MAGTPDNVVYKTVDSVAALLTDDTQKKSWVVGAVVFGAAIIYLEGKPSGVEYFQNNVLTKNGAAAAVVAVLSMNLFAGRPLFSMPSF